MPNELLVTAIIVVVFYVLPEIVRRRKKRPIVYPPPQPEPELPRPVKRRPRPVEAPLQPASSGRAAAEPPTGPATARNRVETPATQTPAGQPAEPPLAVRPSGLIRGMIWQVILQPPPVRRRWTGRGPAAGRRPAD
ncbi:MAG: hypothetical protein N3A57_04290 [Negativicutes bacterium]|nr:hypothetical protein [Negativicutes bacterium]